MLSLSRISLSTLIPGPSCKVPVESENFAGLAKMAGKVEASVSFITFTTKACPCIC